MHALKHTRMHTHYLLVNLNCTQTQYRVNAGSQGAVYFILLPVSHYGLMLSRFPEPLFSKHTQPLFLSPSLFLSLNLPISVFFQSGKQTNFSELKETMVTSVKMNF